VMHEVGHMWSSKVFGGGDPLSSPGWAPWLSAMQADRETPSRYATSSAQEDVAEATALYLSTVDHPALFERYRARFSARFALVARWLGDGRGVI
jgi:hypothetical protein